LVAVGIKSIWLMMGIVLPCKGIFSEKVNCSVKDRIGKWPNSLNEVWGFVSGWVVECTVGGVIGVTWV
jgi:hypothetical protein